MTARGESRWRTPLCTSRASVSPGSAARRIYPPLPRGCEQIDVSGKWLLPGLIDAHIHICYNGSESTFALLEKHRDELVLEAVDICKRVLSHGTTTIRDVGGEKYIEMSLRDAINRGFIEGPRMKLSGRVISMTGGHAHFIAREADGSGMKCARPPASRSKPAPISSN